MLTQEIQETITRLSDLDKIRLIEMLMDSLNRSSPEVERLWIEESERRCQAYKAGKIKGIPLAVIQERYSKRM
ncbi:addiction module protein [candidate division KSB1 bacterium]|nr:addiction module protein [candidate division KSB1 bacterium]